MTRPRLVTIDRADLRRGDRLWGEPNLVGSRALTVDTIGRGHFCWHITGHDDEGATGLMFLTCPEVLIEPRA